MKKEIFDSILASATETQKDALDSAHWRYMSLIGIVYDVLPADVVAEDKRDYAAMIRLNEGLPVFSGKDCIEFMIAKTGLSAELCEAWMEHDYYELNRETHEETLKRLGDLLAEGQQPSI